jgi:hypothetical protein
VGKVNRLLLVLKIVEFHFTNVTLRIYSSLPKAIYAQATQIAFVIDCNRTKPPLTSPSGFCGIADIAIKRVHRDLDYRSGPGKVVIDRYDISDNSPAGNESVASSIANPSVSRDSGHTWTWLAQSTWHLARDVFLTLALGLCLCQYMHTIHQSEHFLL